MEKLLNYYIVHRESGLSYDPDFISRNGKIMTAIANSAIKKERVINVERLLIGLAQRRYRLVPKTI
jgi:hypothetical protein